jgi:hypothetical protein
MTPQHARSTWEESSVRLCKLIGEIGAKYDRLLPMSSEAHDLLRKAEDEFKQWIPSGYLVEGNGGKGKPAITPRIAIFDPDQTRTTRRGLYVAYLFAADNSTVTLTLNQGVTEMAEHLGRAGARLVLAQQAATIRKALRPKDIVDLDTKFDLRTTAALSIDYQHANIVSRTYKIGNLPRESKMVADLKRFLKLQTLAIEAHEAAGRNGLHEFITPARQPAGRNGTKKELALIGAEKESGPEPEIRVDRKKKTLTRTMTRRGLLVALVGAPVVYAAPRPVQSPTTNQSAVIQIFRPVETATSFTIDVSQHDWKRRDGNLDWAAVHKAGIAGMCARATYGDPSGYHWPTYNFGDFARAASRAGMGMRGGYHNLVRGDQASINRQVDWLRSQLDKHDANWAMLDVEYYSELVKSGMWPLWDDVRRFDDRWAEVDNRVLAGYIPPWHWTKNLGTPNLREFRGPLIASNYPSSANEDFKQLYERIGGNDGRGWANYGTRVPEGWQYSSRATVPGGPYICDVNAWRLDYEQLRALLLGRRRPAGGRPEL